MPTIKQNLTRRANAKKSRGPKTERGKAASSQNALKFGFFSRDPIIPGEDAAEWREFRSNLLASLSPQGAAQRIIADRIVDSAWRLRRFPVVEAGIFTMGIHEAEEVYADSAAMRKDEADEAEMQHAEQEAERDEQGEEEETEPDEWEELDARDLELAAIKLRAEEAYEGPEVAMGRAFIRDSNGATAFLKLGRYEAGIERTLSRNLLALERLQTISGKAVRKDPGSAKNAKLQNDLAEGLTITDRAA
jgi:hypothetical protein